MGNYKFKLSHMIPNAWFYKLKDMTNITTQNKKTIPKYFSPNINVSQIQVQPHLLLDQRKSYYITRDLIKIHQNPPIKTEISNTKLIDSPRKSSQRKLKSVKRRLPNRLVTSVSASCNCHTTLRSRKLDQTSENKPILPEPKTVGGMLSCECRIQNDVIHDQTFSESNNLPPIITKKNVPENISRNKKRSTTNSFSPGMKLRMNSPKIGNMRIQCGGRKSLYSGSKRASLAVVKMSDDPRRDFKESMMEMIVENKITAAKELEELLVCYLLLNSDEYHVIIINVFKQIWSDFVSVHLK